MKVTTETGIWVGLVGLFVALIGAAVAFTISLPVGYWIAAIGAILGVGGVILHLVKNWRVIFRVEE